VRFFPYWIIESACEQLQCEFLESTLYFLLCSYDFYVITFYSLGACLNPVDENRQVSERIAALERASSDTNTFWIDPQRRSTIIVLQYHLSISANQSMVVKNL
jgi:hypothetical protein